MSSFDGAGHFTISGSGQPYVSGTTISSTVANQLGTDLANGLSTCILKDGTQTLTASIPFSGFKATGLGNATIAGDALTFNGPLGTPSSATLTNATGLPLTGVATGTTTAWTPTDASGAGVLITSSGCFYQTVGAVVMFWGSITVPVTANGTNILIGGLPTNCLNVTGAGGSFGLYGLSTDNGTVQPNTKTFKVSTSAGVARVWSAYSNSTFTFQAIYPIA